MTTVIRIMLIVNVLIQVPETIYAWSLGDAESSDVGWVLDDSGEKFFPIGMWGIPGYTYSKTDSEPEHNDDIYQEQTAPFNTNVMQAGYQKSYMMQNGTVFMAGSNSFRWMLSERGYTGFVPLAPEIRDTVGSHIQYERMNSIHDHIKDLYPYLKETVIPFIASGYQGEKFIHFIMDEPDTGGGGWFWPPEVIGTYHTIVHEKDPNSLTFIDFGGTISGNRLFYEKQFGDTFRIGTNPDQGECHPALMNTYIFAHDGTPLFRYEKLPIFPGRWIRKQSSEFTQLFYENVYQTALAYKGTSDIVGFNSYIPFRDYPESAGETVDALKAALGRLTPVWLFFDGYGGCKTSDMSWDEYIKLVTCQVYTAVIHGASGVLFYSDNAVKEYWPLVKNLALTLERDSGIFKLPEQLHYWDTAYHQDEYMPIHYSVRKDNEKRYLIITNTDKQALKMADVPGFGQYEMEPLEVRIIEYTAP